MSEKIEIPAVLDVLGIKVTSEIIRDEEIANPDGGRNRYIVIRNTCDSKRWGKRSSDHHVSSPVGFAGTLDAVLQAQHQCAEALAKQELGMIPEPGPGGALLVEIGGPGGKWSKMLGSRDLSTSPTRLMVEAVEVLNLEPANENFLDVDPSGRHVMVPLYKARVRFGSHEHEVRILPTRMNVPCVLGGEFFQLALESTPWVMDETLLPDHFRAVVNIARCKKKYVLIAGKYGECRPRLERIKQALNSCGYAGLVLDENRDIEEQSLTEKMVTYASISRFVIDDDLAPSGHIKELEVCSAQRFTTAILRLKGRPSTAMQADIADDVTFMKAFEYESDADLEKTVGCAARWAEQVVVARSANFNRKYTWRNPYNILR